MDEQASAIYMYLHVHLQFNDLRCTSVVLQAVYLAIYPSSRSSNIATTGFFCPQNLLQAQTSLPPQPCSSSVNRRTPPLRALIFYTFLSLLLASLSSVICCSTSTTAINLCDPTPLSGPLAPSGPFPLCTPCAPSGRAFLFYLEAKNL